MGKKEKSGRRGKNWEGSFTLPLPTDKTGYATEVIQCPPLKLHRNALKMFSIPVVLCLGYFHSVALLF